MTPDLSILFAFRNREPIRVKRCLDSLAMQTHTNFEVIFVDTGSELVLAAEIKKLVESYDFASYIYTDTRGLYWNKAEAINIAADQAKAEFLLSTDIDMIYAENFVEAMLEKSGKDRIVNCFHHFLPENFDDWGNEKKYIDKLRNDGEAHTGAAMLVPASVYLEIGGYDEYYRLWGTEDSDMHHRLITYGLSATRISNETAMFHQWHRSRFWKNIINQDLAPSHTYRKKLYFLKQQKQLKRNTNPGKIRKESDRLVLARLTSDISVFDASPYLNASASEFINTFMELKSGEAIKVVNLHHPMVTTNVSRIIKYAKKLAKKLNPQTGLGYEKNMLWDAVDYLIMEEPGLIGDYYFHRNNTDGHCIFIRA